MSLRGILSSLTLYGCKSRDNDEFSLVKNEFEKLFNEFKESESMFEEKCLIRKDIMIDEIDLRVESLKGDLDNLRENFLSSIEELYKNFMEQFKATNVDSKKLENLKKQYPNKTDLLIAYQQEITKMRNTLKAFLTSDFEVIFQCGNFKIEPILIGKLGYSKNWSIDKLEKKIETRSYREIYIDIAGSDVCMLPNTNLMITCYDKGIINIYENDFRLSKKISSVGHSDFRALTSTTNNLDKIYIADYKNNRVVMTNLSLHHLKTFRLAQPFSITFNEYVYVCSSFDMTVHKLSQDLLRVSIFKLADKPWQIKVSSKYAVVRYETYVGIHDIDNFKLIKKIENTGNICLFNDYFIISNQKNLTVYNMSGNIERTIASLYKYVLPFKYHGLEYSSKKLVLTLRNSMIIVIE